ncbi:MAG TPA: 5-dehydro-4-deoxy-D-glucuronate isomerase [Ligilactobacillus acidipiscis]|uniref:4-deoxy-L-threo-5-hexosulose-uronate ketol-isomerase n=1 Tax=Ligilactobacillus acidipiscis TaxID=89059 RepID=A0A921F9G0_9LACO|nr:5-dehydro-4-deoxy-D-glucuronate isomerase [Ligilactobacillus acidipiscis]
MSFNMDVRYAHSPEDIDHYNTDQMRQEFLTTGIFTPGNVNLTYTYNDRMIFGGVTPTTEPLEIVLNKELGVEYFLQRRELGFINIGGEGSVTIDGKKDHIVTHDGYYISMGTKNVIFESDNPEKPAKFYVVSTPAHRAYPTKKLPYANSLSVPKGDQEHMNKRTIHKYIDASQMDTCQLQMGYTVLEPGSSWNTMPAHTHARRMETYLYCEFSSEDTRVMHIMGTPNNTKHIWLEPEQAVVNPSYSIHCGVGTESYAFIWAMCGENQTYDDMDEIGMHDLR